MDMERINKLLTNPMFLGGIGMMEGARGGRPLGSPGALGTGLKYAMQGQDLALAKQKQRQAEELNRMRIAAEQMQMTQIGRGRENMEKVSEWMQRNPDASTEDINRFLASTGDPALIKSALPYLTGGSMTSNQRDWQSYAQMTPEQRSMYDRMRRGYDVKDLGDVQAVIDEQGNIVRALPKALSPEQRPEYLAGKEVAKKEGAETGRVETELQDLEANYPELVSMTQDLSEFAEDATYRLAGQGVDIAAKEVLGVTTPGAKARASYESTLRNQVLPLLRQTFGAAFTAEEGKRLESTLGDPNATPPAKQAALEAFMKSQRGKIRTSYRRLGKDVPGMFREGGDDLERRLGRY